MMNRELTKEECIKALNELYEIYEFEDCCQMPYRECIGIEYKEEFDTLKELINEHFELKEKYKTLILRYDSLLEEYGKLRWNPPLKFEELETATPVWDNLYKQWILIGTIFGSEIECVCYSLDDNCLVGAWEDFEENRFYRHEVKADG